MKQTIKLFFIAVSMVFIYSCSEDKLDTAPITSFSDATVFDNLTRVDQQVNGLYASIKNGNFLGGRYYVYHDIRAENFLNETANNVTGFSVWNHTTQPTNQNDVTNLWNTAYLAINRINVFLAGLDANQDRLRGQGVSDAVLNGFRGEARFMRALSYYCLAQLYARPFADGNGSSEFGLPLQLSANVAAGSNEIPRATVGEVYTQILQDLDFAEANLPDTRGNAALNVNRAIKSAPIALKTRVYQSMGRYQDVITEANKLVPASAPFVSTTAVPHALASDVRAVFSTPYTHVERIFSLPFTELDLPGTQNGLGSYYNPGPRGIGDYTLNPDGIMANAGWEEGDARRGFIFFNSSNSKNYWNKFPAGPQHTDHVAVIRYAEVLLNLAEARARTAGVDAQAIALLNAVRTRSNGTAYTSFGSAQELIDAIMLEREIEFLGEGHKGVDLQRLLLPLPGKSNVFAVPSNSTAYLWPIPIGEMLVNSAMRQNPGY